MAIVPIPEPSPRARAVEAVLRPLLDLFEAATGGPAAFFAELRLGGLGLRYAFAREGGLVETAQPAAGPMRGLPVSGGLRVVAPLHAIGGDAMGHLEAASLGGRPFGAAAQEAIEACARLLEAHFAATAFHAPPAVGDALSDPLTGLPNRAALLGELERMLARAQRDDMTVFSVCVGLSGMDDAAGSEAFEGQLAALAARLVEAVRGGDLVARTGHHEFVVAGSIPRATAEASAAVVLERLHARCIGAIRGRARIDMGFAVARIGEFDPLALLAEAEASLLA
jgi:diguanylate cyclase